MARDPLTRGGIATAPGARRRVRRQGANGALITGSVLFGLVVCGGLFASLLSSWGPRAADDVNMLVPPGTAGHLLGTDRFGYDVLSRVLHAVRLDLLVGVSAVVVAVVVGSLIGAAVGYLGGWADEVGMRVVDILQAFPAFVLALAVAAVLGGGPVALVLVLALVNVAPYIRLMRSEVRAVRSATYVEAARCAGNGTLRLLLRHIVPNCLRPVFVLAPLNCGWAVITLAGLSFLGLGVEVTEAEWGAMINTGAGDALSGDWWPVVFPGAALFVTVLALALISEGLQSATRVRRS